MNGRGPNRNSIAGPSWTVTEAQARTLDAVLEHGRNDAAARALGISLLTLNNHIRQARLRMGHGPQNRITRVLLLRLWMEFRSRTGTTST